VNRISSRESIVTNFHPDAFGPIIADLLQEPRLLPLGPGTPNKSIRPRLQALTVEKAFAPEKLRDRAMAETCLAGLWLYHDFLDESHTISQSIATSTGSYWHGIMHRREPDAANAAYWFRRVGSHPVLQQVREQAQALGYAYTSPFDFIDLVEKVRGSGHADEELARKVQQLEWQLLFDYCYLQASGAW
jgi:hypothetical protein